MFKVVRLRTQEGKEHTLFVGCSETGYSAKDVMTIPGAYEECTGDTFGQKMLLRKLSGTIGAYTTELYGLCLDEADAQVQELTSTVATMLSMPTTAISTMMNTMSEDLREGVRQALDVIHFCEKVTEKSKVCLPEEAMVEIPPETAEAMKSAKQHYALRDVDNQEIFQKAYDAEFGIILPSLEEIHDAAGVVYEALDVGRVLMPYRRPGNPPIYETIYHTPYFRVGMNANLLPKHLRWIDGYASNDVLDIQPNERRMQKNLYTLYTSDVARYVQELVTGIFFNTEYGSNFVKLKTARDRDVIGRLVTEIQTEATLGDGKPGVVCSVTTSQVDELWSGGWDLGSVGRVFKDALSIDEGLLEGMITSQHVSRRVIATGQQLFTLTLSDAEVGAYTDILIKMGFISHDMHNFLVKLCQKAYEVNWGHTGVTHAIPMLVDRNAAPSMDKLFSQFLAINESGKGFDSKQFKKLYDNTYSEVEDDSDTDSESSVSAGGEGSEEDSEGIAFDYYVTTTTYNLLSSGAMSMNTLTGRRDNESESERLARLDAQDSDTKKIERWRTVNGEGNLVYFLTTAYAQTADVNIFIQAFLKLCRWGERRPTSIVFLDHKEIRHVFDLGLGKEAANTTIVNEDDLVKVNGCDYSLVGLLNSTSNRDIDPAFIVGFLLQKNYGTVTRQYLASWSDLAEMVQNNAINIGEFKMGAPVDAVNLTAVEDFEKKSYELYESDRNIAEGMQLKLRARELSDMVLLPIPSITTDRSYTKAVLRDTITTTQDRQYNKLHTYIGLLKAFYGENGEQLSNIRTTMDLQDLGMKFAELLKSGPSQKQDHNSKAASGSMRMLNLDMGDQISRAEYLDVPLGSKFTLITDQENCSIADDTWEPIKFTDPELDKLSSKYSIVLLLCKTADCWLLCRKDISRGELDFVRTTGKPVPSSVKYSVLREAITRLLNGSGAKIKGIPLRLHTSARLPNK